MTRAFILSLILAGPLATFTFMFWRALRREEWTYASMWAAGLLAYVSLLIFAAIYLSLPTIESLCL